MTPEAKYAVITKVPAKPGRVDDVAEMFRKTNPGLVAEQSAWLSARLLADRESDTVVVVAMWSDAEAYRKYADGPLRQAMTDFIPLLAGPPEVQIFEILVDM